MGSYKEVSNIVPIINIPVVKKEGRGSVSDVRCVSVPDTGNTSNSIEITGHDTDHMSP